MTTAQHMAAMQWLMHRQVVLSKAAEWMYSQLLVSMSCGDCEAGVCKNPNHEVLRAIETQLHKPTD